MSDEALTIPDLVRRRAVSDGHRVAYTFLSGGTGEAQSITWSQLRQRASELAELWLGRGVAGQPVLLAMASGLKFVEALMACWYAGAIAVPVSLPRHARVKHRLDRVVCDARTKFAIGLEETRALFETVDGASPLGLTWLDPREPAPASEKVSSPVRVDQRIALLQYTSGSTGSPRGVIVTHANLMHNSGLIASACGHGPGQTIGGWLPLFHDMGLIGLLIQAAYSGAGCVFMSPERFLMRPWLWLQMITDFNVCSSPAPNFAFDLCVDRVTEPQKSRLDLSRWKNALNGAEPVRARTLERFTSAFQSCGFSRAAFFPCYGLAEATLLVTGPLASTRQAAGSTNGAADISFQHATGRVACGAPMGDTQLAIVDPEERRLVPSGQIGEIWVSGDSCAQGYWNDPDATQAVFKARLCAADKQEDQRDWLRTGDLGFIRDGQLFITGRIRDLIIIAGRNLFPADLEQTVESAHPAIAPSGAAAFSIDVDYTEQLVVAVELRREFLKAQESEGALALESATIRQQITAAVTAEHGVTPSDVALLRAGALPRTTSGKLRRGTAREQYLSRTLACLSF
jgi:acyl-CoA synthetase (AMP-forming)/AMP-acid ligase II